MIKTRGKILRQPGLGPGIVMIEGQQFRFQLEGVWRSEIAPQPGQVVEVELDRELQVVGLSVIADPEASQQIASGRYESQQQIPATTGVLGKLCARLLGRDTQRAKSTV